MLEDQLLDLREEYEQSTYYGGDESESYSEFTMETDDDNRASEIQGHEYHDSNIQQIQELWRFINFLEATLSRDLSQTHFQFEDRVFQVDGN